MKENDKKGISFATENRTPTFGYAIFVLVFILGLIMIPSAIYGLQIRVLFLLSWLLAFPLCMRLGYTYKELQKGMFDFMPKALLPVVFSLIIGAMTGIWNACGTIPYITNIGLKIIVPEYFHLTSFIICVVFALITGTSWGTAGTIGLALMGVALGMDIPALEAAAPIVCGAYIGDAISPLSDTTNIISGCVGVDLMEHVKYQLRITVPAFLISCVYFFIVGSMRGGVAGDLSEVMHIAGAIQENYRISLVDAFPILVVIAMLVLKVPTIPSLLSGTASGLLVAVFYQGTSLKDALNYMWNGFTLTSGDAFIDKLFSRGGMSNMSGTAFMIIVAFGLFGVLTYAGFLKVIASPLVKKVHSNFKASVISLLLGLAGGISSSATFSQVFTSNMMLEVYDDNKISRLELANCLTVGGLMFSILIPWCSNSAAVAGFLDIEVTQMIPHLFTVFSYVPILLVSSYIYDRKHRSVKTN